MSKPKFKDQYDRPRGAWKYAIFITILSCIILVPYISMFVGAFQDPQGNFTWKNWSFFLHDYELPFSKLIIPAAAPSMLVSFGFAFAMAALVIIISVPASYCLSRTDYPGRHLMAKMMIVLEAFPSVALLVPFIFLLTKMKLTNSLLGVLFLKVAIYMPSAVWLMKGFFDHINWDIEWAAIVDGASKFKTFLRIIVPAAKPGIAVIAVNSFLMGWGEYILIMTFIQGKTTTMSSVLGKMYDWEGMSFYVDKGMVAAACLCYILPVILVFILAQKTLLEVDQGGSKQ